MKSNRSTILKAFASVAIAILVQGAAAADTPEPIVASAEPLMNVVTHHKGVYNGRPVSYRAIAGQTMIRDLAGKPEAKMFSIAYLADGAASANRPVTFLYNGGPGSASFWIQMGAFGPKIIPYDAGDTSGRAVSPGHALIDNPDALLDVTDIVFIDPVGTGFSQAAGTYKNADFYKISTDAESVANFIRVWLSEHRRWGSPRFIGGESYGTLRTAMVIRQQNWMTFNGAILISQGLDWGTVIMPPGYDLGYSLFLPTYTATAWYHHKLPHPAATVEAAIAEAETFSATDYVSALAKGAFITGVEKSRIAARLADLTGIPAATWVEQDLRLSPDFFRKQLLANQGLSIGRFDTRFTQKVSSGYNPDMNGDPSLDGEATAYIEAMRTYLSQDLAVANTNDYQPLTSMAGESPWTYDLDNNAYINPSTNFGAAMRDNPSFTIFLASGYYDSSSPVYSAKYSMGHAGLDLNRLTMSYYPTGHMMYIEPRYRAALLNDIRSYIGNTLLMQGVSAARPVNVR